MIRDSVETLRRVAPALIKTGKQTYIHMRGVGFLRSAQAKRALITHHPVRSRIISVRFEAVPFKITVIHVYALTSASSDEDIEAFYSDIEGTLAKTGKSDVLILTDWNAKVGADNAD